ncbi:MAG TPA: hypothetical protein GYA06_05140 [Chloroflexi bacterium]|nr:hypothetical protein [Chloroflexota bacterium]
MDLPGRLRLRLYPFIQGKDGFKQPLSDAQCAEFGAALRQAHDASLPPDLRSRLPVEDYSPRWRRAAAGYLRQAHEAPPSAFAHPLPAELAARR